MDTGKCIVSVRKNMHYLLYFSSHRCIWLWKGHFQEYLPVQHCEEQQHHNGPVQIEGKPNISDVGSASENR